MLTFAVFCTGERCRNRLLLRRPKPALWVMLRDCRFVVSSIQAVDTVHVQGSSMQYRFTARAQNNFQVCAMLRLHVSAGVSP